MPAAVLLPVYLDDSRHHLLFVLRSDRVRDHKGQISFPGGAWEEEDETMQATALREARAEVGLAESDVEIHGALDEVVTIGSHYLIAPFVGVFPWPYDLRIDLRESDEAFGVPLAALLDPACLREGRDVLDGQPIPSYTYHYENRVIWGATARILHQFLDIVAVLPPEEPPDEPPAGETKTSLGHIL